MNLTKILSIALVGLVLVSSNQSKAQVSIGANLGVFKFTAEGSDAQFGFNLSGKYEINDKIRVGANLGYYFKTYDFLGSKLRSFTMPITGLIEFSFSDNNFSPYAGADIGIYRFGLSGNEGSSLVNGYFGIAPVAGFNYSLSDNLLINTNIKYHYVLSDEQATSAFGVSAGIFYKF
ncbi:MAG: porin family protein [Bacteroidetes bacterium]|nr:porin family protein [Bacteroidota bacterium]